MKFIILLIFLLLPVCTIAQKRTKIFGHVISATKHSVSGATITFQSANKRTIAIAKTDSLGYFSCLLNDGSSFLLNISAIGYRTFESAYQYPTSSGDIALGNIELVINYQMLDNVIITGKQQAITIKTDTIEYKADSFLVRKNADVEGLLKKLPGVTIEQDGSIVAGGKEITKIKVNGKDFFDGNVQNATKNIPANIVDKIQVIDEYNSATSAFGFKAQESEKVINIQLKKLIKAGYFARSEASAGITKRYGLLNSFNYFNDKSQLSVYTNTNNTNRGNIIEHTNSPLVGSLTDILRMNKKIQDNLGGASSLSSLVSNQDIGYLIAVPSFKSGISKNNSIGARWSSSIGKKLSFYGSYIYYNILNNTSFLTNGEQFFFGNERYFSRQEQRNTAVNGHRVFANIEYKPDSSLTIRLKPTITFIANTQKATSNEIISSTPAPAVAALSVQNTENKGNQYLLNLTGIKKLKKNNKLIELNSTLGSTSPSTVLASNYIFSSVNTNTSDQLVNTKYKYFFTNNNANLVLPLRNDVLVKIQYGLNYNRSLSDRKAYSRANAIYKYDSINSNRIESENLENLFGLGASYKWRHFESSVEGTFQSLKINRSLKNKTVYQLHQTNFLPSASANYKLNGSRQFVIKYARSIVQPNYLQVLPATDTSHPLLIIVGNPALAPESINRLTASFTNTDFIGGSFILMGLSYLITDNKIITTNQVLADGKMQVSYINAKASKDFSFLHNLSRPFLNKLIEITAAGVITHSRYSFYSKGIRDINSLNFNENFAITINKKWCEWKLGYTYKTEQFLATGQVRNTFEHFIFQNASFFIPKIKVGYNLIFGKHAGFMLPDNDKILTTLNSSVEYEISDWWTVKLEVSDLFNTNNTNFSRLKSKNLLEDARINNIGQYFLLNILFKINKF
jgi:hypothetical protein